MGRHKKNRVAFPTVKVDPETVDKLREIAMETGYTYADGASLGALLDRLAEIDRELLKVIIKKN
jgi:predicted transcriptional regulator